MAVPRTLDLIDKAKQGDTEAFASLIEHHRNRLSSLIGLRLGSRLRERIDVDDVFQETCLRAFLSLDGFEWRNPGSFGRWLGGIAENVLRDLARHHLHTMRRAAGREVPLADDDLACGQLFPGLDGGGRKSQTSPSQSLVRDERFQRLEAALGRLSKQHREVIILARIRGLPIKEIATRMNRKPDAVSMLLMRALRRLKVIFGETESLSLPQRALAGSSSSTSESASDPGANGANGKRRNGGGNGVRRPCRS